MSQSISHFLGDATTGTLTDQERSLVNSAALLFGGAIIVGTITGGLVGNALGHRIAGAVTGGVLAIPLVLAVEIAGAHPGVVK